jgi:hypothetical protein
LEASQSPRLFDLVQSAVFLVQAPNEVGDFTPLVLEELNVHVRLLGVEEPRL